MRVWVNYADGFVVMTERFASAVFLLFPRVAGKDTISLYN